MVEQRAESDRGFDFARGLMKFLMNAALVIAPGFLGCLAVYFVAKAFLDGVGPGFRSLAAVVFPLMVLAFAYAGRGMANPQVPDAADDREAITPDRNKRKVDLPDIPVLAEVAAMTGVGAISMLLLELSTTIPVVELVLATGFSFIVYVLGEGRDRAAPYCLGLVIGSLGYAIIVGVPHF